MPQYGLDRRRPLSRPISGMNSRGSRATNWLVGLNVNGAIPKAGHIDFPVQGNSSFVSEVAHEIFPTLFLEGDPNLHAPTTQVRIMHSRGTP